MTILATLLTAALLGAAPPCAASLAKGLPSLEKLPMAKRLGKSLELLARSCPAELGELAPAAAKAARLPRAKRAKALAEAAKLAPPCRTDTPAAPAGALLRTCPPAKLTLAEEVGRDLDAGTYLFVVAASQRLETAGAFDAAAERVLSTLVLAAALEGEAAR
ncbi:MAG: hypothetical protein ACYC8T_11425 [Myxococcaceae bacterium]